MNSYQEYIKPLQAKYVNEVVRVHLRSFPTFFLSSLGPNFLALLYHGICSAPEGFGFVFLNSLGEPAGFVAGSSNPRGFYSRLLKRDWIKFAFASLTPVLKNPGIVKRVMRSLTHPSGNPLGEDVAGLFSIGVLPGLQDTGAGKRLVQTFLDEARTRGCHKVFLTTDRDNNEKVNNFYLNLGFSIKRQYSTPEGRRMNEFWISIT